MRHWQQLRDTQQLPPGGVEDQPCPPGWPAGIPCVIPSELPGIPSGLPTTPPGRLPSVPGVPTPQIVITEEEAREREADAYDKGASDERSKFIMYTVAGSVISGVVGIALGRIFG